MSRQLYQYHPSWGYTFIPELRTRVMHEGGGYLLSTNASGFRSPDSFRKEHADRPRVLLFGDSFSAGMGVSDSQCYGNLLQESLGAEFYNFSLPGTGTDQHYLIWKDYASKMEHDVVVIAVQVENIRRVNSRFRRFEDVFGQEIVMAKPYFELKDGEELSLRQYPVPKEFVSEEELSEEEARHLERGGRLEGVRRLVNRMGQPAKEVIQKALKPQPLPEYDDATNESWMLMKGILEEWQKEIEVPVIIMLFPLYHYIEGLADPGSYQSRFSELDTGSNLSVVDPLSFLQGYSKQEKRDFRFPMDIHPTISLHRAMADFMIPELRPFVSR